MGSPLDFDLYIYLYQTSHIEKVKCDTSKNIPLDEASALNQDSNGTTFIQLTLYSAQAKYSNTSIFVSAPLYS